VGGSLTEFTGAKLGFWHLVMNVQAIVGIFLLVNLYLGWSPINNTLVTVGVFVIQCLLMTMILSVTSAVFARLRIDQLAGLGWKILVPLALLQLAVVIIMGV